MLTNAGFGASPALAQVCPAPQSGPPSYLGDRIEWFDWTALNLNTGATQIVPMTLSDGRTITATVTVL